MTPEETGQLLGTCAAYDRRTVGEADVIAWFRVLGDLPYTGCEAAVIAHYTDSSDWIMPADIRRRVRQAQAHEADQQHLRQLLDPDAHRAQIAAADSAFLRKLRARRGDLAELKSIDSGR
jgi:hypothetical protein